MAVSKAVPQVMNSRSGRFEWERGRHLSGVGCSRPVARSITQKGIHHVGPGADVLTL